MNYIRIKLNVHINLSFIIIVLTIFLLSACQTEIQPLPRPNLLNKHNGFWKGDVRDTEGTLLYTVINDVHVDNETGEVTVYARSERIVDNFVLAPPQLAPGECEDIPELGYVCGHPDSVYLNGSGEELSSDDGNDIGSWWVKHSWVLNDPSGYLEGCRLGSKENYNTCYIAGGVLNEDGNMQKIGITGLLPFEFFNLRYVDLSVDPVEHYVDGYGPAFLDLQSGLLDFSSVLLFRLVMTCQDIPGPLDKVIRDCPDS